ncbi:MAG TPA: DUF3750 domain-containing protein [Alphaproteobacteria bacterium]|jgi:hypothetical protein
MTVYSHFTRRRFRRRWPWIVVIALLLLLILPLAASFALYAARGGSLTGDWARASRATTGQAPLPAKTPEAVVQVYAARAFGWRGVFGVHMWFALKPENAAEYTRAEVMGFGVPNGARAVRVAPGVPDGQWFGNVPEVVAEWRGHDAGILIPRILAAAEQYPDAGRYTIWPGPNSNSFVAHVARSLPEMQLSLPSNAVGKDYLGPRKVFARAPSDSGWQVSLWGVFGLMLARDEGVELNLFGFVIGVDLNDRAIKLPGFGNIPLYPARAQ